MAGSICFESSASSFGDESIEDKYYQLLDVFQKLHGEAMKMEYQVNRLKSEKRCLDDRIENLHKENESLKSELERLNNSPRQSIKENEVKVQECTNCPTQLERINYLMNTLPKFTLGSFNLEALLGSQRSVLNKQGIGYTSKSNLIKVIDSKVIDANAINSRKSTRVVVQGDQSKSNQSKVIDKNNRLKSVLVSLSIV
ncbi:hypothetical protein V8G54_014014 [Vigna mungo]|uniref:Uncharacterized protein n=1 Tax=Vigna mungo TaxID=3915 RepID=A0AAQ3RZ10_VIGMU